MLIRFIWPALIWVAIIFVLTLMPGKFVPPVNIWDFVGFDKLAHLVVFSILVILFINGFEKQYTYKRLRYYPKFWALLISLPYGFILEAMQGIFLKDRYFELYDLIANTVGCVLGIIIYKFVQLKIKKLTIC